MLSLGHERVISIAFLTGILGGA